ncbi:MAG TPA: hypothetical protein VM118_02060 [Acidobacteriota bacterium]|nr:hypothetical protein [Acidobacteriota bacterium]
MPSAFDAGMWLMSVSLVVGYFYLIFWVARDAGRIGRSSILWGILIFVNPVLFGLVYYFCVREAVAEVALSAPPDSELEELQTDPDIDRLVAVLTRAGWSYSISTHQDEYGQDWTQVDASRGSESKVWRWPSPAPVPPVEPERLACDPAT